MNYLEIFGYLDIVVLGLFGLAILTQLTYYLIVYLRVTVRKEKQNATPENTMHPVSVIICARNEEEHLVENLTLILEQDYPEFEVIVVNDCSEDNIEQVLLGFKQKYPHLRSTIIKKDGSFLNCRKFATTVGIRAAQYEHLLFTYADCRPRSNKWIASMSRQFVNKKDIVLGYTGYHPAKSLLNKWIRYDGIFAALQYFGFALLGKAYTGTGRNLAYRKSIFLENSGFAVHAHILSDEDGLFVNKAAKKRNVAVTYIDDAHIKSQPIAKFKQWMWQKSKQISSSRFYSFWQSLGLTLEPLSRVIMWLSFIAILIFCDFWEYALIVFLLRMLIYTLIFRAACKKFKERGILQYAVLFDFIMPFVHLYLFIINRVFSRYSKWK